MEPVTAGRLLRRRWPLVLAGVLISLAIGGYLSRGVAAAGFYEATAQVLVDARTPLIASTTPTVDGPATGADIAERAIYIADLVASSSNTGVIARAAGLQPAELSILAPTFQPVIRQDTLLPAGELPQLSALAAQGVASSSDYQVLLNANYTTPVITVTATALTMRQAASLTQAAMAAMRGITRAELATTVAAARAPAGADAPALTASRVAERSIAEEALTVKQLGAMQYGTVPPTTGRLRLGIVAGLVLFAVWCLGVVCVPGRDRRTRRGARDRRRLEA